MADRRARINRQPALDGLRGLAVAGVLLYHGGHLAGGFRGVDAFFVLSGFLITSLLLAELRDYGTISLRAFWSRRARRLLPALAVVLVAVVVYAAVVAKSNELTTIRGDAFATLAYVANWRAISTSRDYWAAFRNPSPLDHTWSLAIEEQFYIAWPIVVIVVARGRSYVSAARRVLVTSLVIGVTSFVWAQLIYDPSNPSRVYYGTDTRIGSIVVGAVLAAALTLWQPARVVSSRRVLEGAAAGSVGVLALAWSHVLSPETSVYRVEMIVCALAVGMVIVAAVHPTRGPIAHMLSFRPLRALGAVSYGVYLWHWPVYLVLDQARVHLAGWPLLGLRIVVTLAIACASFCLVEQPIRHGVGSPRVMRGVAPAVTFGLVLAIVFTTVGSADTPTLHPDVIRRSASPPAVPRILVVGNSVAMFTGDEGFKRLATFPRMDVLNRGQIGCRFLAEEVRTRWSDGPPSVDQSRVCRDDWAEAVTTFRPNIVMMLFADATAAEYEVNGHWTAPCEAAYDNVFAFELHAQIRLLASTGARVVITTPAYTGLPFKGRDWYHRDDCQNATIRRVAASEPSAILADEFAWMCPRLDVDCAQQLDGVVLRPDGVHFRGPSARLFAQWLLAETQRAGLLKGLRVVGASTRRLAGKRPSYNKAALAAASIVVSMSASVCARLGNSAS